MEQPGITSSQSVVGVDDGCQTLGDPTHGFPTSRTGVLTSTGPTPLASSRLMLIAPRRWNCRRRYIAVSQETQVNQVMGVGSLFNRALGPDQLAIAEDLRWELNVTSQTRGPLRRVFRLVNGGHITVLAVARGVADVASVARNTRALRVLHIGFPPTLIVEPISWRLAFFSLKTLPATPMSRMRLASPRLKFLRRRHRRHREHCQ